MTFELSLKRGVCVCVLCVVCAGCVCAKESEGTGEVHTNSNFEIMLAQTYAHIIHDFSERNTEATWMRAKSLIYRIG